MRQIEFRGYDTESKCWRYGYYFCKEDITLCAMYDSKEHWEKDKAANEHHLILWNGFSDWNMPKQHYQSEVDGESIGQFTGLYDKNKKKIYDGDIVKRHGYTDYNYCCNVSEIIGTVVYEDCGFVVKHFDKDNKEIKYITPFFIELSEYPEAIEHYEVIGNIYENPYMLNE